MKKLLTSEWEFFKKEYWQIFKIVTIATVFTFFYFFLGSLFFQPEQVVQEITEREISIEESGIRDLPAFERFLSFASHNGFTLIKTISFGFIPLVILPFIVIYNTIGNLGKIYATTHLQGGSLIDTTLFRFGGHALIETVSMIMAVTIGAWVSIQILKFIINRRSLFKKESWVSIFNGIKQVIKSYMILVLPLVIVAAFMEAYVSPFLNHTFG